MTLPDVTAAVVISNRAFLEAVFADALPGTHTIITAFRGDPYKVDRTAWAGRPWRPSDRVPGWYDTANSYMTVSVFEPDPETGELRRRKANFSAMHAVMVDDVGTKVSTDRITLPPSALLETSPGNCQAMYFIAQNADSRNRDKCELLVDAMVRSGLTVSGADPGMKGVTRFARLPVGVNGKAKYVEKLGAPFRVRCLEYALERRYTIQHMAAKWGLDLTATATTRVAVSLTPEQAEQAGQRFEALIEALTALGLYRGRIGRGRWHEVTCPWISEHTDGADNGSAISEPGPDNAYAGGFRCHHSHGERLHMTDLRRYLRALAHSRDAA